METFKERMKRIRVRAGYKSQQRAADAIGCERGTIGMWEAPSSGVTSLSEEYLFDAAKAYKVRPEWINDLGSEDDGYPFDEELAVDRDISKASPSDFGARLSPSAQESIHKIAVAAARAEGNLDRAVAFFANWISLVKDPKHVPSWTAEPSPAKKELKAVFEAAIQGISDKQADSLSTVIGSLIPPVADPDDAERHSAIKKALVDDLSLKEVQHSDKHHRVQDKGHRGGTRRITGTS